MAEYIPEYLQQAEGVLLGTLGACGESDLGLRGLYLLGHAFSFWKL